MSILPGKPIKSILIVIGLAWLTLGCQAVSELTNFGLAGSSGTAKEWPYSTLVPLRNNVEVNVGEPLPLESYHMSPNKLDKLEIFVNGEPVEVKTSSEAGVIFSYQRDMAEILVDAPFGQGNAIRPTLANSSWSVSMVWIGQLPGTYKLSVRVTDKLQRQGELVTQPIEVKASER